MAEENFHSVFQVFPLNPKSMSLGELYGENDLSTNEWKDGVLSALMRSACAGNGRNPLSFLL